jgi:hypothetical protein
MDYIQGGDAAIREVEIHMIDLLLGEVGSIVCLIVEPHHSADLQFLKDRHVVIWRKGAILHLEGLTLYLSTGLSEGELKAMNLLGMIQLRSPFSIFS